MAPTHVLRCCQRGLAWIPVIFIALVVCWSYYAYVVELCLYTITMMGERIVYLIFFHVSFVMFVWSYWKTIFTKPANPSKEFCLPKAEKERYEKEERPESQQEILWRAASTLPMYTRTGAGAIRYCDRCQVIKPDRCHHCSACDMCVLKMDHHCPWVNNCVGFSNYKFFILFLAYSLVYCLFIAATVLQYFIKFWTLCRRKSAENCPKVTQPSSKARSFACRRDTHAVTWFSSFCCLRCFILSSFLKMTIPVNLLSIPVSLSSHLFPQNELNNSAKFHVLFLFFVAAMFCISILSLFSYHLWLVGKNRSTIEAFRAPVFRTGSDKNGFSLGFRKNIAQVFGDQKQYWLLPIYTSQGDGLTFPTRLVNADAEQATVTLQPDSNKCVPEVSVSPLSESQNRLLSNEQQANNAEDHLAENVLKSAESETVTMESES
ncbi:palmitoyltransferase ZDHHC20-B isoform X1 [Gambusia affinis]|uniref:palmitoyltransferase ZDHHC20-B isoform X1 n=1 Tax=Gambusia affinis TaxID=33528 RepID=UPI001CDC3FE0|nr:palmitoyltransferase ZDHHC20-B isoform X1 [Gambusia affinis]